MFPKNPEKIIIKNKFYNGLKEIDIWNYYKKYKHSILEQSKKRNVMFFIKIDDNIIIKRKNKKNEFIRLNANNYNNMITGRTLSIHGTMNRRENIAIVDIDTNIFDKAKEATYDCYNILKKYPIFIKLQIRFTGKNSFHIYCKLSRKVNIDSIRLLLFKIFNNSIIKDKYTIKKSKTSSTPNIDIFRNVYNGGFILLNSLSTLGLRCVRVPFNSIKDFKKEYAKI